MIYWTERWIRYREAKYVTAALVTWAVGMYVFLEVAPALLILPMMWLWHCPPLRLWALAVGAGATLVIWYPCVDTAVGDAYAVARRMHLTVLNFNHDSATLPDSHTENCLR
jgi:hypothetical protein